MIRRVAAHVRALFPAAGRQTLTVVGDPDSALLACAAALRRLGGRITRYDVETATLEARIGGRTIGVAVRATGRDDGTRAAGSDAAPGAVARSTIQITGSGTVRPLVRRLRAELAHPTGEAAS